MSKFKIGERVVTNGAAPKDNTMQMMPNRVGTVVGYDTDGKNEVMMDGESEPSFIADHELDPVAAKFFGVKGTAEKVINDGFIHPVKVGKAYFVIDGEGQGYVSLCVTCEDTGDTLYPMFKATAENLKGMLAGCDRPNMGYNFSLADLFPRQKTFKMLFGKHSDGTGFVRIYGMCFNGEVTYEGR